MIRCSLSMRVGQLYVSANEIAQTDTYLTRACLQLLRVLVRSSIRDMKSLALLVAASAQTAPAYTQADVRFMQGMIGHHSQALAMVALIPSRTNRPDLRALGERIRVSQQDEIALM